MILEFLQSDYAAIVSKLIVIGILWCAVLAAMLIDLYFGIRKAKKIGEKRRSEGYRRSVEKFNHYYGMMLFAFLFDAIVPSTYFFVFPFSSVPFVSLLATVALVFTEAKSVQEKAEDKLRRKTDASIVQVIKLLEKREDLMHELLANYKKDKPNEEPTDSDLPADY